jgi:hypothetical protein
MFGFLFLSFGLLVATSAAVTILMIYFLLCAENYHWQWRAFASSGASAGWVFAYSLLYWIRMLRFSSFTGVCLYIGYSILLSSLWFLLSGMYSRKPQQLMRPNTDSGSRLDRLHCLLGVCAQNLLLDQGRLKRCPKFRFSACTLDGNVACANRSMFLMILTHWVNHRDRSPAQSQQACASAVARCGV